MNVDVPARLLADLERAPRDRPVLLLLRHAERPPIAAGEVGHEVPLTDAGRAQARALGAAMRDRPCRVSSSPVPRAAQTAECLGLGPPTLDRRLGDPGVFIADAERAWPWFRDHRLDWLVTRQIERDDPLDGLAPPAEAVRTLVAGMMPAAGLHVAVTHDALLGVVAGRLLGRADLPLPGFLEGLLVWPAPGGWRVCYRGEERAVDAATLRPRAGVTVRDGRIHAPNLELSLAEHCNLTCAACTHLSPGMPRRFVEPDALAHDLARLARVYRAERVKLMGGEPLLHPRLPEIATRVRASGVGERVIVCTNGVLLHRMGTEFWEAIDGVVVARYPGVLDEAEIGSARAAAEAHGRSFEVFEFAHFRENASLPGTDDDALVGRIWRTCHVAHRWRCHNVRDGRFAMCPQALFLPEAVAGLPAGGVSLQGPGALLDRLLDHLDGPDPLPACRHCLGSAGRRLKHHQTSKRSPVVSAEPTERLVDLEHLARMERCGAEIPQGCLVNEAWEDP